jgi:hypothetical protein
VSEPKIDFDVANIKTQDYELLKLIDDLRRWFNFREDRRTPAMQTFEGALRSNGIAKHYVKGKVYGVVGWTQNRGDVDWRPMKTFPDNTPGGCSIFTTTENEGAVDGVVEIRGGLWPTEETSEYRITVFYIGNPNAN